VSEAGAENGAERARKWDEAMRRCPDPNARIQKTEDLQIKTENTKLRLRKI